MPLRSLLNMATIMLGISARGQRIFPGSGVNRTEA